MRTLRWMPVPPLVLAAAPTSAFAVGTRQLNLMRGDRPLRTVVWHPATGAAGGAGRSGAVPAPGPFPVVLFSHGLTASPESCQALTVMFAAAGFVVVAPAYPFTSSGAATFTRPIWSTSRPTRVL